MMISRERFIQAASQYAKKHGWRVADYVPSEVDSQGGNCVVAFTGKSKKPGDHFRVYLDCKTGAVLQLIPGR